LATPSSERSRTLAVVHSRSGGVALSSEGDIRLPSEASSTAVTGTTWPDTDEAHLHELDRVGEAGMQT